MSGLLEFKWKWLLQTLMWSLASTGDVWKGCRPLRGEPSLEKVDLQLPSLLYHDGPYPHKPWAPIQPFPSCYFLPGVGPQSCQTVGIIMTEKSWGINFHLFCSGGTKTNQFCLRLAYVLLRTDGPRCVCSRCVCTRVCTVVRFPPSQRVFQRLNPGTYT